MSQYGVMFKKRRIDINGVNIITQKKVPALIDVFEKILPEDNGEFFNYDDSEASFR